MNYEQFICAMLKCTQKKLSESEIVEKQKILKNNGILAVGLTIRKEGEKIAPLVYLEEFYKKYLAGDSVEMLSDFLIEKSRNTPAAPVWNYETFWDFRKIKDQIVYKLVNTKKNENLLKEIPHLPFLDFAVVFYVMIPAAESESCSVLIRNTHMDLWKLPISVLYEYAQKNTPGLCPYIVCPLTDFMKEWGEEDSEECPMLILTNAAGLNGASAILYPGMTKYIYERVRGNYYLLPASIHEFLIIPENSGARPRDLLAMVKEINETQIQKEEFLSDYIYYFDGDIITKM